MWETSEGGISIFFFYVMKLKPSWDSGVWEPKVSTCQKLSIQAFFSFLVLGDGSGVSVANWKEEEEKKNLFELTKTKHALILLEGVINVWIHEFSVTW